jgi:hypothetical protein
LQVVEIEIGRGVVDAERIEDLAGQLPVRVERPLERGDEIRKLASRCRRARHGSRALDRAANPVSAVGTTRGGGLEARPALPRWWRARERTVGRLEKPISLARPLDEALVDETSEDVEHLESIDVVVLADGFRGRRP